MKRLTLIRHAKSSHDDPSLRDFYRTLNERGLEDAPRMGRHLAEEFQWSPDLMVCSTALRTLRTAKLLLEGMGDPDRYLHQEGRIYESSVSELIEVVQETDDSVGHLCIIGHNPGMENLTNWLVGERAIQGFVTCAVAMLELDISDWRSLKSGCGKLTHYLEPRKIS